MRNISWDYHFLGLAVYAAGRSKDPSTKVGSVIVDSAKRVVSMGFNGFPQGVEDRAGRLMDRDIKLRLTIHAEANAILFAQRNLHMHTLYSSVQPCAQCAAMIIQSGIKWVIAYKATPEMRERWGTDFDLANDIYEEAGVYTAWCDINDLG